MEALRALQRKSAVELAVAAAGVSAADAAAVAEALLVLADAFGAEALEERAAPLLGAAPALLRGGALWAVAAAAGAQPAAAVTSRPQVGQADSAGEVARLAATCGADLGLEAAAGFGATLEGLELAQSALEDFVVSYFPLHGLKPDSPQEVLRFLPALSFVEGHIYDLDQANEDSLLPETMVQKYLGGPVGRRRPSPPGEVDPFGPLRGLLRERGWLGPLVEAELVSGARFWSLERRLCGALADASAAPKLAREDVEEALRLKSFDYRVMNLLLYAMRCAPVDEECMRFLACAEVLVEIGDDLTDYEEDVERNSFNVYRCFLALYGPERGQAELRAFICAAEGAYAEGLAALQPEIADGWRERCQASRRHGSGSERGPGGGAWALPPPIDEAALRRPRAVKRPRAADGAPQAH